MKRNKKGDELTTKMHSGFTVSNDLDQKHAAWAALSAIKNGFMTPIQAMASYGVSKEDLEVNRDEWKDLHH